MAAKLLLIEVDPTLRAMLSLMLRDAGFRVEVCRDAVSGLRKAYTLAPDLVLVDARLPDMDRWETCRRLREICDVPIIMLLALEPETGVVESLGQGADAYLVKPVSQGELVFRIRTLLRRAPSTTTAFFHKVAKT